MNFVLLTAKPIFLLFASHGSVEQTCMAKDMVDRFKTAYCCDQQSNGRINHTLVWFHGDLLLLVTMIHWKY